MEIKQEIGKKIAEGGTQEALEILRDMKAILKMKWFAILILAKHFPAKVRDKMF